MSALPSLYAINADLLAILGQIEEAGGEVTPEIERALALTEEQFTAKAVDYGQAILTLKAMSEAAAAECERLAGLRKYYDNAAKRLSEAISGAMQAFDRPKVETPTMRLFLRHTQTTVIDDLEAVPDRFKTVKVEKVANKTEIKKAIQGGEAVDGAHLQDNASLQIK